MEVLNALGRRKSAVARIYVDNGNGTVTINNRDYKTYFPTLQLQYIVEQPMALTQTVGKYNIKINLQGGGVKGQAEAVRLAIARALMKMDASHHDVLKANGLLTRDPREVERKKPGQPKARKRFQFSKR